MTDINFSEYLSEAEMRAIAEDEFRKVAADKSEEEFERVLGNRAFKLAWQAVDKEMDGKLDELIKQKVKGAVTTIGTFHVFRDTDPWSKNKSVGQQVLDTAIRAQADRLAARLGKAIDEAEFSDDSLLAFLAGRKISFGEAS